MNADTLMDEAVLLSDKLSEYDEKIAELREEIQSFLGTDPDSVPLALPADWDFDAANEELNNLLRLRHKDASEYRLLCERQQAEKAAEVARKLAELKAQYREAVARMLRTSIEFAKAVGAAHVLRMECRDLTGRMSDLRHIGPLTDASNPWDLSDPYCLPAIWCREAKEFGLIDGDEDWLAGISMTGALQLHRRVK